MNFSLNNNSNQLAFWVSDLRDNSYILDRKEISWASKLSPEKSQIYKNSRSFLRKRLSELFNISPLDVPLVSPPGVKPFLRKGYGHVSLSHSFNKVLVGWSSSNIGVDIESKYRKINSEKLYIRFFSENEKIRLKNLNEINLDNEVIKLWVIKESCIKLFNTKLIFGMKNLVYNNKSEVININNKQKTNIFFSEYKNFVFSIANNYALDLNS